MSRAVVYDCKRCKLTYRDRPHHGKCFNCLKHVKPRVEGVRCANCGATNHYPLPVPADCRLCGKSVFFPVVLAEAAK